MIRTSFANADKRCLSEVVCLKRRRMFMAVHPFPQPDQLNGRDDCRFLKPVHQDSNAGFALRLLLRLLERAGSASWRLNSPGSPPFFFQKLTGRNVS